MVKMEEIEERKILASELLRDEITRINRLEKFAAKLYLLLLIIFGIVILLAFRVLNVI